MVTWNRNNTGKPDTTDYVRSSIDLIAERIDNVEDGLAGTQDLDNLQVTGGNIDGTPVGVTVPDSGKFTEIDVDNVNINTNTIKATDTNGDLNLIGDGTGGVRITRNLINNGICLGFYNAISSGSVGAGEITATRCYSSTDKEIKSLAAYLRTVGAGVNMKLALYADTSGNPTTLLGQTNAYTIQAIDQQSPVIIDLSSPVKISANTFYWIAILTDTILNTYRCNADASSFTGQKMSRAYGSGFTTFTGGTPVEPPSLFGIS